MFGFRKGPKQIDINVDNNDENKGNLNIGRRTSSEPMLIIPDDDNNNNNNRAKRGSGAGKDRYKNDFADSGGLQSQTTEDLENYAVYKSEETTKSVNNCLKIAEDIKQDATKTLDMLHAQGEQITRTHNMAVDIDKDLGRGEKLLNNLGGMFSKPWKPKKTRDIKGPLITADNNTNKNDKNRKEQREKLGINQSAKGSKTPPPEPTNAMQKVEYEKAKQDDGLSDLSNILGDLKGMALDMGSELDRQNKALDHLDADVDELNSRVKGANQRARKLIG